MKISIKSFPFLFILFLTFSFCTTSDSFAALTKRIIQFGGNFGPHYSPEKIDAFVGDTIVWVSTVTDDFVLYDLVSTSVPAGAPKIGPVTTGNTYSYIIQYAGEYDFHSNNWDFGSTPMRGKIIATSVHNGLSNEGREFYLGMIYPNYNTGNPFFHVYAMINSFYANEVTVNYFDDFGAPLPPRIYRIPAKGSIKLPLDTALMRIDTSQDIAEYKSCHITSKRPITVEYLSIGQCSGGSYLALPVLSLGKQYVAASYNDGTGDAGISNINQSGGAFLIIGAVDGTRVQITPRSTTRFNHIGVNNGRGVDGHPHPFSVNLNKGQTFLVRTSGDDTDHDLSGSVIDANNPVIVISGHQNAAIGGVGNNTIEGRDYMVEQMIPYELWTADGYISMPLLEPTGFVGDGHGDKYRIYSFDDTTIIPIHIGADADQVSRYNFKETRDITAPIEISSDNGKKISVMQYDERAQPVQKPWPAPSMMTVVPKSHWKKYFAFTVLDIGDLEKILDFPYINVLSDHLSDIKFSKNGTTLVSLNSLTKLASYNSASQTDPSIAGGTYRLTTPVYNPAASIYLTSDYPFMVYLYEMRDVAENNLGQIIPPNAPHEYAAPAGMLLNTGDLPKFEITVDSLSKCSTWSICAKDLSAENPGIKAAMLVDDSAGIYFQPGAKAQNVILDTSALGYEQGEYHPKVGGGKFCFNVNVDNPLLPAIAPIAIIDNQGNASYFILQYRKPSLALATDPPTNKRADSIVFPVQKIGDQICTSFVFKNTAAIGGKSVTIKQVQLINGANSFTISSLSHLLPHDIAPQEADTVKLCYFANDTLRHRDSLLVTTDCFRFAISLDAHASTGLIYVEDLDFGFGAISRSLCNDLKVTNVGTGQLQIKTLKLSDDSDFTISAATLARLPITLLAGKSTTLTICFTPKQDAPYSEQLTIGTDLTGSFANAIKSISYLNGIGVPLNGVPYNERIISDQLKIRPNPASGNSVVASFPDPLKKKAILSVLDVLGRNFYSKEIEAGASQIEIPIKDLTAGIYYVQLATEEGVLSQKLDVLR
jgi:hypothetical protein